MSTGEPTGRRHSIAAVTVVAADLSASCEKTIGFPLCFMRGWPWSLSPACARRIAAVAGMAVFA